MTCTGRPRGGLPVRLAALLARELAPALGVASAVELAGRLRLGVTRTGVGAVVLGAGRADAPARLRGHLPALGTQPLGAALGVRQPGVLLVVRPRLRRGSRRGLPAALSLASRVTARPVAFLRARPAEAEPGRGGLLPALRAQALGDARGGAPAEAFAVGGTLLRRTRFAHGAPGRGRAACRTSGTGPGRDAFGGAPVEALQVAGAPRASMSWQHIGVSSVAKSISGRRTPGRRRADRTSGRPALSPSVGGRGTGPWPGNPSTARRSS